MEGGGGGAGCPEAVFASLSELQAGSDVWANATGPLYPPNGTRSGSEPETARGPSLSAVILLFAFLRFQLKGRTTRSPEYIARFSLPSTIALKIVVLLLLLVLLPSLYVYYLLSLPLLLKLLTAASTMTTNSTTTTTPPTAIPSTTTTTAATHCFYHFYF